MATMAVALSNGYETLIDSDDADLLEFRWWAIRGKGGGVYAVRRYKVDGKVKSAFLHRYILSRMLGRELVQGELGDHINRTPLDNRRTNLRVVTPLQSVLNRGMQKNNSSGFKGVKRSGRKWEASITLNGKYQYLGTFDDAAEAALAYDKVAIQGGIEYVYLNFPNRAVNGDAIVLAVSS